MKARDVVGKRIVRILQERVGSDPEYYGPPTVCFALYLDDGTRLTAHAYESSDQPIASIEVSKDSEQ